MYYKEPVVTVLPYWLGLAFNGTAQPKTPRLGGSTMNIFKKWRSRSPTFEMPRFCLPHGRRSSSVDSGNLKVPKTNKTRAASFDVSSDGNTATSDESTEVPSESYLQVPTHGIRSKSFDSAYQPYSASSEENMSDRESSTASLQLPKFRYRRRSLDIPRICIHCVHLETLASRENSPSPRDNEQFDLDSSNKTAGFYLYSSSSESSNSEGMENEGYDGSEDQEFSSSDLDPRPKNKASMDRTPSILLTPTLSETDSVDRADEDGVFENAVSLTVPNLKQRSSSMDVAYIKRHIMSEEERRASVDSTFLDIPSQNRSSSVDVSLPTPETKQYKAVQSCISGKK